MSNSAGTSTYRQRQAQETKERVVGAARALMARNGWTATSIEAIAAEAGVSPQTIYVAFGSKRALLTDMREVMLRDAKIPVLMEAAAAEAHASRRLQLWASLVRWQMETSYDVISIHRQAAASDPAVASAYREVLDNRARAFARFIHDMAGQLPEGMDERTATDILWALSNEELYRELVKERGWSASRYEAWLGATLVALVVGPGDRLVQNP